jgi:hypothetical protein
MKTLWELWMVQNPNAVHLKTFTQAVWQLNNIMLQFRYESSAQINCTRTCMGAFQRETNSSINQNGSSPQEALKAWSGFDLRGKNSLDYPLHAFEA